MIVRPGHEKCHHEGGGLYRKTPAGAKETISYRKLRRKQWVLRKLIEQGASKYQIRQKANFMNMKPEDYAYIMKEMADDE